MADLSITATQVLPNGANLDRRLLTASGVTVTAGQTVYKDTSVNPNVWRLAKAIIGTPAPANGTVGIAMVGAGPGQPLDVSTGGSPILGAGAAPSNNTIYCVSANAAGAIAPLADIVSNGAGTPITILGIGNSTSNTITSPPAGVWPTGQLST